MKQTFLALLRVVPVLLSTVIPVSAATGLDAQLLVSKVFATEDELVLKLTLQSSTEVQYVIRSTERSGGSAVYNNTARVGKTKRFEGTSWIVMSRVHPNREERIFEKVLVQNGAVTATTLGKNVRVLPHEPKPFVFHEQLTNKTRLQLNKPLEIVRSDDLALHLIVGEQLDSQ